MDLLTLKQRFDEKITFWSGGDTQNVLGKGTTEGVAENVRKLTGIFKPGSGFVFNQVYYIMDNLKNW